MGEKETRIMLPWSRSCFVCGQDNERGMQARSYLADDGIVLPFTAPREFCGWATVVHGGLVSTVLDEVMTWAAIVGSRKPCYAAEITIRMLAPLAPGTDCLARATLVRNRKRIFFTEALLEDEAGHCYARGEGRYMLVPLDKVREFQNDFVHGPDCHDISDIFGAS